MRQPAATTPANGETVSPPIPHGETCKGRGVRLRRSDDRNFLAAPSRHVAGGAAALALSGAATGVLTALGNWSPVPWLAMGVALAYVLIGLEQAEHQLPGADAKEGRADDL